MKTYYICAAILFTLAYAVFHFGFRQGGEGQLYRINDRLAFELLPPNENFNGVTIRSVRPTKAFVNFIGGAFQTDSLGAVEMLNVNYRQGDFVYTDVPQHEKSTADIINVKTGETINVNVPPNFKFGDDISNLPEYNQRGLVKANENKLTTDYVKTNFQNLSTFTNRCLYAHLIFTVAALFLAFPQLFIWVIDVFVKANDPTRPENYYRISAD